MEVCILGVSISSKDSLQGNEECYLVMPNRVIFESAYNGYGIFGGKSIFYYLGYEVLKNEIEEFEYTEDYITKFGEFILKEKRPFDIKVVSKAAYNGETYEELPASQECEYKGFYYSTDYIAV